MKTKLTRRAVALFESIKKTDDNGIEYWSSRDLARILEYRDYRNFLLVLNKAKESCNNSNVSVRDHFVDVTDMEMALAESVDPFVRDEDGNAVYEDHGHRLRCRDFFRTSSARLVPWK